MPKRHRPTSAPSLGFALIAKDAAPTLAACLDSIRPYCQQIVVAVDERTTDATAKIARKHGADVVAPVQVSTLHDCPQHGQVLAQHFARARNESFTHLDPSLEWIAWIDADDVLKGGEHLAAFLAEMPESVIGSWHPYHYATVNNAAQTNTLFHRERILRQRVGWTWQYRVHEVVTPTRQGAWKLDDGRIAWFHQEGAHKSDNSAARNLLLLEIDLEENPDDTRAIFYIGNQYFAMGEFAAAAAWYERLLGHPDAKNPYERWQSAVYASIAYERQGDLTNAIQAAHVALDENPTHPEPYFRLASAALLAGEFDKCEFWTKLGRERDKPPFFVFTNPLDYSFNNYVTLGDALAQQGRITEAKAELEQAYAVLPDPKVGAAIEHYAGVEQAVAQGEDFKRFAHYAQDDGLIATKYASLPDNVQSIRSVRDVVMPAVLKQRPNTQPRIVFYCGRSFEEWYPGTLDTTGIGGSETAVIEISRRFASAGWRVDVYNGAGRYEGLHDGVGYWEPERFDGTPSDVLVSWRQPGFATQAPFRASILWCHDLNYGHLPEHVLPGLWDAVLGVSQWHAAMLRSYYGVDADFVPNGINLERFPRDVQKQSFQCVYASSPDRGLVTLLKLWPKIVKDEPGAKLIVAYGWDNMDKLIASGRGDLAHFKANVMALLERTPQVEWRGRLPQNELAHLYAESAAWLYPSGFLEVSCISAMEAMAGGAVPVASVSGALPETIGDAGVIVPGPVHSPSWQDFYALTARGVLCDPQIRMPLMYRGKKRAESLTWDHAFGKWEAVVEGLLSGKKELVAA